MKSLNTVFIPAVRVDPTHQDINVLILKKKTMTNVLREILYLSTYERARGGRGI